MRRPRVGTEPRLHTQTKQETQSCFLLKKSVFPKICSMRSSEDSGWWVGDTGPRASGRPAGGHAAHCRGAKPLPTPKPGLGTRPPRGGPRRPEPSPPRGPPGPRRRLSRRSPSRAARVFFSSTFRRTSPRNMMGCKRQRGDLLGGAAAAAHQTRPACTPQLHGLVLRPPEKYLGNSEQAGPGLVTPLPSASRSHLSSHGHTWSVPCTGSAHYHSPFDMCRSRRVKSSKLPGPMLGREPLAAAAWGVGGGRRVVRKQPSYDPDSTETHVGAPQAASAPGSKFPLGLQTAQGDPILSTP